VASSGESKKAPLLSMLMDGLGWNFSSIGLIILVDEWSLKANFFILVGLSSNWRKRYWDYFRTVLSFRKTKVIWRCLGFYNFNGRLLGNVGDLSSLY